MIPARIDLELWYRSVRIGYLRDSSCSDATWYGQLELTLDPQAGKLERQLANYIQFSEEWIENAAMYEDASAYDEYSELINSGEWFTIDPKGTVGKIHQAPVFFDGGEVSWSVVGEE